MKQEALYAAVKFLLEKQANHEQRSGPLKDSPTRQLLENLEQELESQTQASDSNVHVVNSDALQFNED